MSTLIFVVLVSLWLATAWFIEPACAALSRYVERRVVRKLEATR